MTTISRMNESTATLWDEASSWLISSEGTSGSATKAAGSATSSYNTALSIGQTAVDLYGIAQSNAREQDKIQAMRERAGLAVADYYTFGLASVAYGYANERWPGFMQKLRSFDQKWNIESVVLNKLFNTDKWKTEGNRLQKLVDKGIDIPEPYQSAMHLTRGQKKEELLDPTVPNDFVGIKEDGSWANNKFVESRDEKDLHPEDIWGYAAFFEKFGNDWLGKFDQSKRRALCQKALDLGLVREHHGTIEVQWNEELENFAKGAL